MPPPPCELSVMPKPSMLDGLHWKLLGNGLVVLLELVWHRELLSPTGKLPVLLADPSRNVVPVGKVSAAKGSDGKRTPLESTVIAAPSSAPIRVGSCNSSARLPLRVASQPTVASRGKRSTWGLLAVGLKSVQPLPQPALYPFGDPLGARPNKQSTLVRQTFILPAGCVLALMMLDAAPTPCSRTGFHISNISKYVPGPTMIMSPGIALSIAFWSVPLPEGRSGTAPALETRVGVFPPTVTVTVSMDCLPLPAVMINSPQSAVVVPAGLYCACC